MKVIYNRINEEFLTLKEAQDMLYEIAKTYSDLDQGYYSSMDIDECCERLNDENIYDCGKSFYVVEDDISKSDLQEVIYG